MSSLVETRLECNNSIKINFDGGDLSSELAYNLFNWFKRLVLPAKMSKLQVDTIRLKLIKIASRIVRSARYIIFKLCSSCPYKTEFYETLENIRKLKFQPKLE